MNICVLDTECIPAGDEHEAWLLSQQGRAIDSDQPTDFEALERCREENPVPAAPLRKLVAASVMRLSASGNFGPLGFVDILTFDAEKWDESEIVQHTLRALEFAAVDGLIVTFNGQRHDLPLLMARAMKYRISLPPSMDLLKEGPRHEDRNVDLMQRFSRSGAGKWAGMAAYAAALDIPAKMTAAPTAIPELVERGKWSAVREHVEGDVITTALLYARWRGLLPHSRSSAEDEAAIVGGILSSRSFRSYAGTLAHWQKRCLTQSNSRVSEFGSFERQQPPRAAK